jgi:hypothetical protein
MPIMIAISPGELIDKLTILAIKIERIADPAKLANVRHEYETLTTMSDAQIAPSPALTALWSELQRINEALWEIEDDIRDLERAQDFGAAFIALARAVYQTNDRRAATKRAINDLLQSDMIEEKSYAAY